MARPVRSPEGKRKVAEYVKKYQKEKYDSLSFRLPKGQRDIISGYAKLLHMDRNTMIKEAIREYIKNHLGKDIF